MQSNEKRGYIELPPCFFIFIIAYAIIYQILAWAITSKHSLKCKYFTIWEFVFENSLGTWN